MLRKHSLYTMQFEVPKDLIASEPSQRREEARLFAYDTISNQIHFDLFKNISQYLPPNTLLVLNDTKVIKARTHLKKETGGKIEVFFLLNEWGGSGPVPAIVDRTLRIGDKVFFDSENYCQAVNQNENIFYFDTFFKQNDIYSLLEKYGEVPLPPYIKNSKLTPNEIEKRYQTVFAKNPGSVAAPTASLHFTNELLKDLSNRGIKQTHITLDVGLGTFANMTEKNIKEKRLHKERFQIPSLPKKTIKEQIMQGRRVAAVGTTSVRTLETNAELILNGDDVDIRGETDIFIFPPYNFKIVDTLITNFHLPGTSLIMLVEAFLQHKKSARSVSELYKIAIENKFRFYSFGDSMLIV